MATIIVTQTLIVGTSNLVSVHNPNIITWAFVPNNAAAVITSKVQISMQGSNKLFNGTFMGLAPDDSFLFELDLRTILKYAATGYSKIAHTGTFMNSLLVTARTIEFFGFEGSPTPSASASINLYLSHGVNQIGNPNGSNLKGLYDNEPLTFNAANDLPFELYYFVNGSHSVNVAIDGTTILTGQSQTKGLKSFNHALLNVKGKHSIDIYALLSEKLTTWTNTSFDIFIPNYYDIGTAEETSGNGALCYSNNITFLADRTYIIDVLLTMTSGTIPTFKIGAEEYKLEDGVRRKIAVKTTGTKSATFSLLPGAVARFAASVSIRESAFYQHIDLNTKDTCGGEKYISYLSREGFYRYWLFDMFSQLSISAKRIGTYKTRITNMATSDRRENVIGYEDAYNKISVMSRKVSIDNQQMLLDIFTSPSVYVYENGQWVGCMIEGGHTINNKKEFDILTATIVMPELYTQTL
jgi:hypothetical protein